MIRRLVLLAVFASIVALGVRADELTLKDGSKINGTIVGYQADSFRVKTTYGFAVVRKDQVASIRMTDLAKAPAPAAKNAATAGSKKVAPEESAKRQSPAASPDARKDSLASAAQTSAAAPHTSAPGVAPAAPTPVAAAAPPPPATPPLIREQVSGNSYINETYGFSMYKPPDWQLIEGARSILPGAITAMGTGDETTYLLIGQDSAGKSIESQMATTVNRLAGIMDNFRPLAETRLNISGTSAIERRFHGTVDQHDWSGVVVLIPRGPLVFTIFGMTYAETDLVQIQENVIARAISSIQFANR